MNMCIAAQSIRHLYLHAVSRRTDLSVASNGRALSSCWACEMCTQRADGAIILIPLVSLQEGAEASSTWVNKEQMTSFVLTITVSPRKPTQYQCPTNARDTPPKQLTTSIRIVELSSFVDTPHSRKTSDRQSHKTSKSLGSPSSISRGDPCTHADDWGGSDLMSPSASPLLLSPLQTPRVSGSKHRMTATNRSDETVASAT